VISPLADATDPADVSPAMAQAAPAVPDSVLQLLSELGEHEESERLVRRVLASHELDEDACDAFTEYLFERGLVRPGSTSWHAARLARRKSLVQRLRTLHENARTARHLLQALGVGGADDLLEQEDLLEYGLARMGDFGEDPPPARRAYWDGTPLDGRSILVLNDEGLGDRLWHARYLPWLAGEMGGRVVVEAGPQLARLLRSTPGVAESIEEAPSVPTTDFQVLPTALPVQFLALHETIPTAPYVFADPDLVKRWRPYVAGGRFTVGLNWGGDPIGAVWRDIPLADFAPLARVGSGVRWIGLQRCLSIQGGWTRPADGGNENDPAPPGMELVRLGPKFADMADTAAVVAQLDLVISSDTSVVHLAAAMGKPTWLILHAENSRLWGRAPYVDPEVHAPRIWYPSLRIFRALPGEGLGPVMQRVADALAKLVAARRAA
jgi:hypothetical protein